MLVVSACGAPRPPGPEPTTTTVAAQTEGAALYDRYCALCHGADGEGYAADNATRLRGQELQRTATDAFFELAIARGRSSTAMGGYSDEYGGPLTEAQILALVAHLRTFREEPPIELSDAPIEGDPEAGALVYQTHCASCHGQLAQGGSAQSLNRSTFLTTASDAFLRHAIVHGREDTPMPGFEETLTSAQIDDVVAFLRRFEEEPHAVPRHLAPPSLTEMTIIRHPDGPTPSFTLREERFVPAEQVRDAVEANARMILMDARPTSDWLIERLPGALPIPYHDDVTPILGRLPRDGTWIVAYCGCPHAASGLVVDALRAAGFENAVVLDEGVYHWIDEGYPTESGPLPPAEPRRDP